MRSPIATLPSLLVAGLVGLSCATTGGVVLEKPEEPQGKAVSFGADAGEGNVVAVQPFMHSNDYASLWLLSAKLENYLEAVKRKRWLGAKTLVVFPEGIGAWLIAVDEEQAIAQSRTLDDVRKHLSQKYLFDYWTKMPFADAGDKGLDTVFRIKGREMAAAYQKLFSGMAREYKVTILAGSIVLPDPEVVAGEIEVDPEGPLYSAAFVFGPDGSVLGQPARKIVPAGAERTYLSGGDPAELPVFETSIGKIGVLLGSDSFFPEHYAGFKAKSVDMVIVPACYPVVEGWRAPWEGFGEGVDLPSVVKEGDVGVLKGHDAWTKYGLPAHLGAAGTSVGVVVFMRGRIWDVESDGQTTVLKGGEILEAPHLAAAVVSNIWLGNAPVAEPAASGAAAPAEDAGDEPAPADEAAPPPPPPPPPPPDEGSKKKRKRRRR